MFFKNSMPFIDRWTEFHKSVCSLNFFNKWMLKDFLRYSKLTKQIRWMISSGFLFEIDDSMAVHWGGKPKTVYQFSPIQDYREYILPLRKDLQKFGLGYNILKIIAVLIFSYFHHLRRSKSLSTSIWKSNLSSWANSCLFIANEGSADSCST